MDDNLIAECTVKARAAFRRSIITTSIITLVFLAFAIDWISLYAVYPATHVVVWSESSQWMFAIKTAIVLVLFFICSYRLGRYATFQRFVDTKAAKDPESFYVLIKRHRDAKKADALSHSRKEEESFDKRVKDALG